MKRRRNPCTRSSGVRTADSICDVRFLCRLRKVFLSRAQAKLAALSAGGVGQTEALSAGLWRNGSASDSRSEGWEFESLWPHFQPLVAVIVWHWGVGIWRALRSLHALVVLALHDFQRPHRLVVRTSRCGRDNPGSTPGEGIFECIFEWTAEWLARLLMLPAHCCYQRCIATWRPQH